MNSRLFRDHISNQIFLCTIVAQGDNYCRLDFCVSLDRFLDFPGFDPMPANLHLEIVPSEEFDIPIRTVTSQIAGPIQSLSEAWMIDEGGPRLLLIPPIAASQSDASDA